MPPKQSLWFRLGYALERTRQGPPAVGRPLAGGAPTEQAPTSRNPSGRNPSGLTLVAQTLMGLADRQTKPSNAESERGPKSPWPSIDNIVATGGTAAVTKLLNGWKPRRKTAVLRLLHAGVAGGAAALLVDVLRPLLRGASGVGPLDRETGDRVLAGIGQGLVYGAVVEPRVPGPTMVKGALYGTAEYAADPAGGISRLLGSHAPQHHLPLLGHLLEDLDPHDRVYVEHLVFGVALALLYGSSESSPSSNGIRNEVEEE
jgi:hypothetical protein